MAEIAALAGIWQRYVNYEPRDVVADSYDRDGSIVVWVQSPDGHFVDVRRVKSEAFIVRGFAGMLQYSVEGDDPSAFTLTWNRLVDTKPQCCPTGVDTACCRVVGGSSSVISVRSEPGVVLMEEGDGYLEVWRRIHCWNEMTDSVTYDADSASLRILCGSIEVAAKLTRAATNSLSLSWPARGLNLHPE